MKSGLVLKCVVFLFLAWVAWKGALRTPEIASRVDAGAFYAALVNDAANAAIMKERHVDFINETLRALAMREPGSRPGAAFNPEILELAKRRETARWYRENVNFETARQNLTRQRRLQAAGAPEPLACEAAPEAKP